MSRVQDLPAVQRLFAQVKQTDGGCWQWTGYIVDGYGRTGYAGRRGHLAHRAMYLELVGPIPEGLTLDHLCHNDDLDCPGGATCEHRRCVNPEHLEAVTTEVNTQRSARNRFVPEAYRKTHCPHGHAYDEANTYVLAGRRFCRKCMLDRSRAYKARKRAAA